MPVFSGTPNTIFGEPRHPCHTCMRSIGFLAHDQPLGSKAKTFLDKEDAETLVREMFAERISAKLIRAFPPDSPFRLLRIQDRTKLTFGSGEVSGTRFQAPRDPAWQELHGAAARSLRTRSYMTLKAWKHKVPADTEMQVGA